MTTNLLITDSEQITDVWAGMEIEDAAKRAPALIRLAEQAHTDLKQQLTFLKLLVAPLLDADKQDVLERYFALANRRADESMALHQQSSEILTHAAWRFQLLEAQPESELAALKTEAQAQGALVVDTSAPVIISYRIPLWHALKAADRVNRSMVIAAARRSSEPERKLYR